MFEDEEAELRLSPGGRTIRLVRSACAWDLRDGRMEIRFRGERFIVPARQVRPLSPDEARSAAEVLASHAPEALAFAHVVAGLVSSRRDPQPALVELLVHDFVVVEVEERQGSWYRPPPPRPEAPELELPSVPALTWLGVVVVDADEPGRTFSGSQFRLRLPDGATPSGALDGAASVRVDDIEPGKGWFEVIDVRRDP